jgi:hypothetical protein
MDPGNVTDDIIDLIASAEMHRQKIEKDSGLAAACNEALRRLHELLNREWDALEARGLDTRRSANIEAVAIEIKRVKKLLGNTRRNPSSGVPRPGQVSLQSAARPIPQNKP